MIILLLGSDDFSKKNFIDVLVAEKKALLSVFSDASELPEVTSLLESDLFSKSKVFVLQNFMPEFGAEAVEKCIATPNQIVISLKSLDKRKKENKEILANKKIQVQEFVLPHGKELDGWILQRVEFYGGKISKDAVNELAIRLGRDNGKETKVAGKVIAVEEVFNLWQADSEIQKLLSFSAGDEINRQAVLDLVPENGEVDVFDLTNAIADNKKQEAMQLLGKFLAAQTGSDEKSGVIQLNALLSEQFRNVAMVQDFMSRKTGESEILEKTGWKSGRLFVMNKIASKFPSRKIIELLNKLESLDEELKSSSTPPRVLLDLILSQLFI